MYTTRCIYLYRYSILYIDTVYCIYIYIYVHSIFYTLTHGHSARRSAWRKMAINIQSAGLSLYLCSLGLRFPVLRSLPNIFQSLRRPNTTNMIPYFLRFDICYICLTIPKPFACIPWSGPIRGLKSECRIYITAISTWQYRVTVLLQI